MTLRFIHAADLHLDTPFTARGRYPEHVAAVLRDASLAAFDRLIEAALVHHVAFVVIAGDVYDGAERGVRAQLRFRDGLQRLSDAGIRCFVAHGNHDPLQEGWSAIDEFSELVTVFGADEVSSVAFQVGDEAVTVHGISYGIAKVTDNLSRRFSPPSTPGLHVGVLHANVGADPGHDPYSPCSVDDLRAVGLDYWALGHIHTRRTLSQDPWVVYPGNLQGRSIRASEAGPKGVLLVDVRDGQVAEPRLLALDLVRFATVEVDATDLDLDGLFRALQAVGDAAQSEAEGRSVLLGATIRGTGALHDRLRSPASVGELLIELREAAGTALPFLWWDSLSVETRPGHQLAEALPEGGFAADLLATAAGFSASEFEDVRDSWLSALTPDLVRVAGGGEPLPSVADLWDEATALALEMLVNEEQQ